MTVEVQVKFGDSVPRNDVQAAVMDAVTFLESLEAFSNRVAELILNP